MRLHAYLTQALLPSSSVTSAVELAQYPGFSPEEVESVIKTLEEKNLGSFMKELEKRGDSRKEEVEKAATRWANLEIVDLAFKGMLLIYFDCMLNSYFH